MNVDLKRSVTMKKLLLIDGSNLMFRAYYATAYSGDLMQNSRGEYTNAIFGLANMLNSILREDFTHVLVAFDEGKQTFRHKTYPEYKAKRAKMPDEFRVQLPYVHEIIEKLGFFQYEHPDYEADDIIGILAKRYHDTFDQIEILSNDRDLLQLLRTNVTMRISKRGTKPEHVYTEAMLMADLGLLPSQIPDLKGLMGDSSDNLPGIPGVGEKTALTLLSEYGSIEGLLKHLNELKGKLKERVETNYKQALMCKELATIITDGPLDVSLDALTYRGFDAEALTEFYRRMEFHSLIRRLEHTQTPPENAPEMPTVTTPSSAQFDTVLDADSVVVLEAYGDNYHHTEKLGFGLLNHHGAFYIPYDQALKSAAFVAFLENPTIKKSTFDMKRLSVMLKQDSVKLAGVSFDLLLAAYVLNPLNTKEDFKVIVENFDYTDVPYLEAVYGKGAKAAIPGEAVVQDYALKKAQAIKTLESDLHERLVAAGQTDLLYKMEMPLACTLAAMEFHGIRIDLEALKTLDAELDAALEDVTASIHKHAGTPFNVASPKQLGEVLFDRLGLPSYKKSKTGYSTNIDVLKKLRQKHPIIEDIIRYRSLSKLQSTYVRGLADACHDDGRIHTIYKQAFTQTGRLSSIEPNLQNIPIRTELGREIRKVFLPDDGHILMASDYSQIELRVLAHMADEVELIKAFKADQDIHTITAKELFESETVTAAERRIAKAVNFGIIYGQSAWGLADDLNLSLEEAETFINRYYRRFNGIATFMDQLIEGARTNGYVETLLKRRRYIPEIHSRIYAQRELGKRTAMNAPIQGSAADIIKLAMLKINEEMDKQALTSTMILQIHDELVFSVHPEEQAVMETLVRTAMEEAIALKVPLTVNLASGKNLDDAK
ncbi:MAG: DNA polymerase I [Acholeplasmatales bacterium]|nr:MAG: DNA polymerase I [Acholeplasmatales bacterium]